MTNLFVATKHDDLDVADRSGSPYAGCWQWLEGHTGKERVTVLCVFPEHPYLLPAGVRHEVGPNL